MQAGTRACPAVLTGDGTVIHTWRSASCVAHLHGVIVPQMVRCLKRGSHRSESVSGYPPRVPEVVNMTSIESSFRHDERGSLHQVVGGSQARFPITVNELEINLDDPLPLGRQILVTAGCNPADEHVLIELLRPGTRSIGLDEEVDLRRSGREAFRAFKSDRLYLFTVDSIGYEWGTASITETELRLIAVVSDDHVLLLERSDEADRVLTDGEQLVLADAGTEHLRTAKKLVRVFLDDVIEKFIPRGKHTTEELLTLLSVTPGYLLNVLDHSGQLQPLQPGQTVHVKEDMKFYSQAPGGGAS